jgi:hypothetical protein
MAMPRKRVRNAITQNLQRSDTRESTERAVSPGDHGTRRLRGHGDGRRHEAPFDPDDSLGFEVVPKDLAL